MNFSVRQLVAVTALLLSASVAGAQVFIGRDVGRFGESYLNTPVPTPLADEARRAFETALGADGLLFDHALPVALENSDPSICDVRVPMYLAERCAHALSWGAGALQSLYRGPGARLSDEYGLETLFGTHTLDFSGRELHAFGILTAHYPSTAAAYRFDFMLRGQLARTVLSHDFVDVAGGTSPVCDAAFEDEFCHNWQWKTFFGVIDPSLRFDAVQITGVGVGGDLRYAYPVAVAAAATVPEPATALLVAVGVLPLFALARRRTRGLAGGRVGPSPYLGLRR